MCPCQEAANVLKTYLYLETQPNQRPFSSSEAPACNRAKLVVCGVWGRGRWRGDDGGQCKSETSEIAAWIAHCKQHI